MSAKLIFPAVVASALLMSGAIAQEQSALPQPPAVGEQPVEAPSVTEFMTPEETAVVTAPAVECRPICVVGEVASLSAKRKYRCYGSPVKQVLCVDNPADCCCTLYSVPVCVPSCCTDAPVCCGTRVGLLGRGYVTYRWSCGFEATIAFRVHGGVLITYR